MKTTSATTLIAALFIASVMLTAVSLLDSLDQPSEDVRLEELAVGRLGPMLSGPTLWSRYPSFPPPTALINYHVMLLVGGLVAATVYVLRIRLRKPLGAVSIVTLALGAFPYALGMLVLQCGDVEISACGFWVAVMVLGVLYASLAAALLATMELIGWHKRILEWLPSLLSLRAVQYPAEPTQPGSLR